MSRPTSFYFAFLVLPRDRRKAIVAVWDFCRAVDDAVDETPVDTPAEREAARASLARWREELARVFQGTPETPQGQALQPWVRRFGLSRRPLDDLIDGVEMDLDHRRYPTFEALYEYCWRVASSVGFVCIEIFGARSEAAREYALNLGLALQLTNIVRDVRQDAARGRIYLPLEDLRQFGVTPDALFACKDSPEIARLLRFEAQRTRELYREAFSLLDPADYREQRAGLIMAAIYSTLLDEIERDGFKVLSQRVSLTPIRKFWLAWRTWTRARPPAIAAS